MNAVISLSTGTRLGRPTSPGYSPRRPDAQYADEPPKNSSLLSKGGALQKWA